MTTIAVTSKSRNDSFVSLEILVGIMAQFRTMGKRESSDTIAEILQICGLEYKKYKVHGARLESDGFLGGDSDVYMTFLLYSGKDQRDVRLFELRTKRNGDLVGKFTT